jgi:hypothetical protein
LKYDEGKAQELRDIMDIEYNRIDVMVNNIISSDIDFYTGIIDKAQCLYDNARSVFGTRKIVHSFKNNERKGKNPWFNNECEVARKELRNANRNYKICMATDNKDLLVLRRRRYKQTKRRAIVQYKIDRKINFII